MSIIAEAPRRTPHIGLPHAYVYGTISRNPHPHPHHPQSYNRPPPPAEATTPSESGSEWGTDGRGSVSGSETTITPTEPATSRLGLCGVFEGLRALLSWC